MQQPKRRLSQAWRVWELANSVLSLAEVGKEMWKLVPESARKRWKLMLFTMLTAGPLAGWWTYAQSWWGANWWTMVSLVLIVVGIPAVFILIAAGVERSRNKQTTDAEERLVFLDPEVPEDSTKRKAVDVVASVRNERSTDAVQCRVRIDSAMSSSGKEGRFIDQSLMWTTGRDEEMIPPETTLRFQIARSHIRPAWFRRTTELVFDGGATEVLKLIGYRPGGTFWLSIELSYSNSKPVYGVYRLDSNKLHDFVDAEDVSESDVVQLIGQFDESPDLEQMIEDYGQRLPETD